MFQLAFMAAAIHQFSEGAYDSGRCVEREQRWHPSMDTADDASPDELKRVGERELAMHPVRLRVLRGMAVGGEPIHGHSYTSCAGCCRPHRLCCGPSMAVYAVAPVAS